MTQLCSPELQTSQDIVPPAPIIDIHEPTRLQRIGRRAAAGLLGISVLTTGGVGAEATIPSNMISDMVQPDSTDQERTLGNALDIVYKTDKAAVHCVPQAYLDHLGVFGLSVNPLIAHTEQRGVGVLYTNTVWVRQSICDTLTGIMTHIHDPADFDEHKALADVVDGTANNNVTNALLTQVNAIKTLVHEGGHSINDTANESKAECDATQTGGQMAVALGYPESLRGAFAQLVIEEQTNAHKRLHELGITDYDFTTACSDGGPFDLDPTSPGTFPVSR